MIRLCFLLLLCVVLSSGLALHSTKCHECANYPGYPGSSCDSLQLPEMKCGLGFDRCMTLKGTIEIPEISHKIEITMRNCSNSKICNGKLPDLQVCDLFNVTGMATSCSYKCCEGDLCDPYFTTKPSLPPTPTKEPTNEKTSPTASLHSTTCHECANYPGYQGSGCDSPQLPEMKCGLGFDRCMTLKGTMEIPGMKVDITMRNCSNSKICNGQLPDFQVCDLFNLTGLATSCSFKCCEGNLCDPYITTKPSLPPSPTKEPTNEMTSPTTSLRPTKCHECANYPGYPGSSCDSLQLPETQCGFGFDRCMTLKGTMKIPGMSNKIEITMRNCSHSLICNRELPDFELCDLFNLTGLATSCSYKCCEGDLCDPYFATRPSLPPSPPMEPTNEMTSPTEYCNVPVGFEDGSLANSAFSTNSQLNGNTGPSEGRLNNYKGKFNRRGAGAWCADRSDNVAFRFIEIDLGSVRDIRRIATQGRNATKRRAGFVKNFRVTYSSEGTFFQGIRLFNREVIFQGNTDRNSIVYNDLPRPGRPPIRARYIRIHPEDFQGHICMRIELDECVEDGGSGMPEPVE